MKMWKRGVEVTNGNYFHYKLFNHPFVQFQTIIGSDADSDIFNFNVGYIRSISILIIALGAVFM